MLADLNDKRALVTGAASGIGLAIATLFAERGARVMLSDIDAEGAAKAAATLPGAASTGCDVVDAAAVEAAVAAAVEAFGGLDRIYAVNVKGVFHGIKYATPALAAAGGGAIVNLASVAGTGGVPLLGAYCATKGAVIRMTETAAAELRGAGIRANAICPAFIDTPMVARGRSTFEAVLPIPFADVIALKQGRLGTTEEVAEIAAFLASDDARFITGAHYILDGGLTGSLL
jgi:NAD(P)-dependent dehydrogenase (short-subunit alcohol dehydrogenase family)